MGMPIVSNVSHVRFEFLVSKANGKNFTVTKNVHVLLKKCC